MYRRFDLLYLLEPLKHQIFSSNKTTTVAINLKQKKKLIKMIIVRRFDSIDLGQKGKREREREKSAIKQQKRR